MKTHENNTPLLETVELRKWFKLKGKNMLHAVDNVNLSIQKGETLGVVGESGCGKSTLGRTILRLIEPTSGKIFYNGKDITQLSVRQMRNMRKECKSYFKTPTHR